MCVDGGMSGGPASESTFGLLSWVGGEPFEGSPDGGGLSSEEFFRVGAVDDDKFNADVERGRVRSSWGRGRVL